MASGALPVALFEAVAAVLQRARWWSGERRQREQRGEQDSYDAVSSCVSSKEGEVWRTPPKSLLRL